MRIDPHVHSLHSGPSTIRPLHRLLRECYNTPERVFSTAKARGMDLVTITDHDEVSGAMTLTDRDDMIVGCEVTLHFIMEERFNENLLFDLVARPAPVTARVPELAA